MNEVFHLHQRHYNLRNFNVFATDNLRNKHLLNSSFTERTNSGRHYPPRLKTVHHCNSLKIKSKLGGVIDINVRFAQDILPMLVIFSLLFCDPKLTRSKIA